jgi:hypothetical protein
MISTRAGSRRVIAVLPSSESCDEQRPSSPANFQAAIRASATYPVEESAGNSRRTDRDQQADVALVALPDCM